MTQYSDERRRVVVKVGSNVLTTQEGKLDITRMSSLVDQIAWLRRRDIDVILVSSGAVACGRKELKVDHQLDSVEQRQLYSAMGQVKLINLYYDLFREYGMHIGQVLTTKENFATQRTYQNQRACMEVMLENDVIPIVNENDTVSIEELMFTDNDELSGLIAQMMRAESLILLSNVNGIYTGNPEEKDSEIIKTVHSHDDISQYIQAQKSSAGRGGMESKYKTACKVAEAGIRVIIANGKKDDVLIELTEHPDNIEHTEFIP
jgi:glutamate 5-kinase